MEKRFHFTKPEEEGQMKPKINKIKRIIKSKTEIRDVDQNDSGGGGIKETKSQFFENINKL